MRINDFDSTSHPQTSDSKESTAKPSRTFQGGAGDDVSQGMQFSNAMSLTIPTKAPSQDWTPLTPERSQDRDVVKEKNDTVNETPKGDDDEAPITLQKDSILLLLRRVEQAEQQRDLLKTLCSQLLDSVSELEEMVRDHRAQKELDDRRIAELENELGLSDEFQETSYGSSEEEQGQDSAPS